MAKTNDEIMDDVAAEFDGLLEQVSQSDSILDPMPGWRDDVMLAIYMTEAHQRGEDLTMAKLAYDTSDFSRVPMMELLGRLRDTMTYATDWRAKRAL